MLVLFIISAFIIAVYPREFLHEYITKYGYEKGLVKHNEAIEKCLELKSCSPKKIFNLYHSLGHHYYSFLRYEKAYVTSLNALLDLQETNAALEDICSLQLLAVDSLQGLHRFSDALTILKTLVPDNCLGKFEKESELQRKLPEERILVAQMWMVSQKPQNVGTIRFNFSNYISDAIALADSPIHGRGYKATKFIKTGELILVQKALAVNESGYLPNDLVELFLNSDEDIKEKLLNFYFGPTSSKKNAKELSENNNMQELLEYFENVWKFNAFMLSSSSLWDGDIDDEKLEVDGLFYEASFFNHSCDPNASYKFIGDVIFIRADRNISVGEEILISYFIHGLKPSHYDFDVECKFCRECQIADFNEEPLPLLQSTDPAAIMQYLKSYNGNLITAILNLELKIDQIKNDIDLLYSYTAHLQAINYSGFHDAIIRNLLRIAIVQMKQNDFKSAHESLIKAHSFIENSYGDARIVEWLIPDAFCSIRQLVPDYNK